MRVMIDRLVGLGQWATCGAKKVNLVVGIDTAAQVERQMQVQQGGWRARAEDGAEK